ncbi:winged helix-turn-helix domain-containing protein [Desulfurococcus amylolyticus]|uniref:winged helix-turn-helix domain-containing protein n=1 Tax=Desulfurococcus amylolyticus TaxID=94694 RepID=UPI0005B1EE6B|nr:winged helix-turn-helix domain-containing protein [Desulfurococcus amylolyticus]
MQARSYTLRVLEILNNTPSLSSREIAEILGIDFSRAKEILERLRYSGYVEKAGRGYIITTRGRSLIAELTKQKTISPQNTAQEKQGSPASEEAASSEKSVDEKRQESRTERRMQQAPETLDHVSLLVKQLEEFSKRLRELEVKIKDLDARLTSLENFAKEVVKHHDMVQHTGSQSGGEGQYVIETPVMNMNEAQSRLGPLLDKYLLEGRLIRIGTLIVDHVFYEEFKKKFPIKASEVSKLSNLEKTLLNEMRNEMLVILYAGKEYRLVNA